MWRFDTTTLQVFIDSCVRMWQVLAELLNMPDDHGSIPLHYACREGMLGTIESMLKMGALLNAKNKEQKSPLHFAAK